MRRAYTSTVVIIQVDDGHPSGPGKRGCYITSSASPPEVVALMLAALDAEPGMRVLEIGTGTGYNAALLAHRLGAQNITSVEIDPRSGRTRPPGPDRHRLPGHCDHRRRGAGIPARHTL
jgi:protein-L-isoaspartate O-methyltransferase